MWAARRPRVRLPILGFEGREEGLIRDGDVDG